MQSNPDFYEAIVAALGAHQEELVQRKAELAAKGLLRDEEKDSTVMGWVKKRLHYFFNLQSSP